MRIAGIDYSITCPALCIYDTEDVFSHENLRFFVAKKALSRKEEKRVSDLGEWNRNIRLVRQADSENDTRRFLLTAYFFSGLIRENGVEKVFMEAYAYNGKGKVFNLAEATGTLKLLLFLDSVPLVLFPPLFVKKTFTGKGNANKEKMISRYEDLMGVNLREMYGVAGDFSDSPVSDVVDAAAMVYTALHGGRDVL